MLTCNLRDIYLLYVLLFNIFSFHSRYECLIGNYRDIQHKVGKKGISSEKHPFSWVFLIFCLLFFKGQDLRLYLATAERIIDFKTLSIKVLQDKIVDKKIGKIATVLAHPDNHLFEKHSSERKHRSINGMTTHQLKRFSPQSTVTLLNHSSWAYCEKKYSPQYFWHPNKDVSFMNKMLATVTYSGYIVQYLPQKM